MALLVAWPLWQLGREGKPSPNASLPPLSASQESAQDCGGASDTEAWLPLLLLPLGAWLLPTQILW